MPSTVHPLRGVRAQPRHRPEHADRRLMSLVDARPVQHRRRENRPPRHEYVLMMAGRQPAPGRHGSQGRLLGWTCRGRQPRVPETTDTWTLMVRVGSSSAQMLMMHHPPRFQVDVLALYRSRPGATIGSVAEDLGVNTGTLRGRQGNAPRDSLRHAERKPASTPCSTCHHARRTGCSRPADALPRRGDHAPPGLRRTRPPARLHVDRRQRQRLARGNVAGPGPRPSGSDAWNAATGDDQRGAQRATHEGRRRNAGAAKALEELRNRPPVNWMSVPSCTPASPSRRGTPVHRAEPARVRQADQDAAPCRSRCSPGRSAVVAAAEGPGELGCEEEPGVLEQGWAVGAVGESGVEVLADPAG